MSKRIFFSIEGQLLRTFPQATVMAMRVWIEDQRTLSSALDDLRAEIAGAISALDAVEQISALPEIALWRKAYGQMGVKPSKFPSSIEALLRRAQKGQAADTGIPAVDLYNAVSLICRVPLGAYDMDKLTAEEMSLRLARPNADSFQPLGGAPESFPLNPALVVYAQAERILCWGFNTRDSLHSAVDAGSRDIAFFSETSDGERSDKAAEALDRLARAFAACGARVGARTAFSADRPSGWIEPA
jgi:DNA/RNA-binding domain of Phe-tRNA-synthetase-like protein